MSCVFITGTDTDAGKTLVGAAMLYQARQQGLSTLGIKPISAGCERTPAGLRNSDALALQAQSAPACAYSIHNPLAYEPPIAPHIAAREVGEELSLQRLNQSLAASLAQPAQFTLIEGAGGWLLPLNDQETLAQWVEQQRWPVVLVVGLKLGCLNHALLTVQAITQAGLPILGWVGSRVDPQMSRAEQNIQSLQAMIEAPCLGVVPHLDNPSASEAAKYIDINPLLWRNRG
ncbi:dethiobiotin synthase [Balneatrix alpica]|uniref:ATP-dependent dethiobiotin synthetase BioD n=1 Tax=Balneatrix alpica TaxID=75684 RepID=A0ABV5ZBB7_9GAMM|nr:dethiobiotin synthase [Balneatrix alpica]